MMYNKILIYSTISDVATDIEKCWIAVYRSFIELNPLNKTKKGGSPLFKYNSFFYHDNFISEDFESCL